MDEKDRKRIYDIWLTIDEQDIQDDDYARTVFKNNLEANSDVLVRFRYVHEWAVTSISLQSSFKENQMHLHSLSLSRPVGIPTVYDGFLDQLAKSIKKYNNELLINTNNIY